MALETPVPLNLPAAGDPEPFHGSSIALDLGHVHLLLIFFWWLSRFRVRSFELSPKLVTLFGRQQHGHAPSFQPRLDVDLGYVLQLIHHSSEHLFP